jgi:ribosomal protein L16 Arg81 hydroxylase
MYGTARANQRPTPPRRVVTTCRTAYTSYTIGNMPPSDDPIIANLLGDPGEFNDRYWQKLAMRRRCTDVDAVMRILTPRDADELLQSAAIRPPYVGITTSDKRLKDVFWTRPVLSRTVNVFDTVDVDRISREFTKGSSILFSNLDDFHSVTRSACAAFQRHFKAPTKASAVVTPPASQALPVHFDAIEGFVVQTYGAKRFRVFQQPDQLPPMGATVRPDDLGDPVLDVVLEAGDLLYMPWGSPHYAETLEGISCHVTFMCVPLSWNKLIETRIDSLIPAECKHLIPKLHAGSPSGVASSAIKYLDMIIEKIDSQLTEASVANYLESISAYGPRRATFLQQARLSLALSEDSEFIRNPSSPIEIEERADELLLRTRSAVVRLNIRYADALKLIRDQERVSLAELEQSIGQGSAPRLAQHLVSIGVLSIVS